MKRATARDLPLESCILCSSFPVVKMLSGFAAGAPPSVQLVSLVR